MWPASSSLRAGQRRVEVALCRLRVVGREVFGEFEASGDSALVELRDQLPDCEHRLRRSASRMELLGDSSERGDLDRGDVMLTEIVLEGLQPAYERRSRSGVQHAPE